MERIIITITQGLVRQLFRYGLDCEQTVDAFADILDDHTRAEVGGFYFLDDNGVVERGAEGLLCYVAELWANLDENMGDYDLLTMPNGQFQQTTGA